MSVFSRKTAAQEVDPAVTVRKMIANQNAGGAKHASDLAKAREFVAASLTDMFEDTHGGDGVKKCIRKRELHRVATVYESVSKFSY